MREKQLPFVEALIIAVLEENEDVIGWLNTLTHDCEIAIPLHLINEALKAAKNVTCKGLHALAHLICLAHIQPEGDHESTVRTGCMCLGADVLLSVLLYPSSFYATNGTCLHGTVVFDAHLVAALLSTMPSDLLRARELSHLLNRTEFASLNPSSSERREWLRSLDHETIMQIRRSAFAVRAHMRESDANNDL